MTRSDLLKIVIGRARHNGFEFRRWYTTRLGVPWISPTAAVAVLESQRRYYALLFSQEFAKAFWKAGEEITFQVPSQSFQRRMADGSIATVTRKPFTRRSARKDAWRYHLKEMALAEEPLRYIRKYLNVEDDSPDELDLDAAHALPTPAKHASKTPRFTHPTLTKSPRTKPIARPLPTDLPKFLQRPYPPKP
jgi:hypothetical protein